MNSIVSKNPIVHKIVDGSTKGDLLEMLINKQLPLTEEEYLESLVFVLQGEEFKVQALEKLRQIAPNFKASYVEKAQANHRVAYFVLVEALETQNAQIIAKLVRNQALPFEFLLKVAEKGNDVILEILLDNQIKLIAYPEILEKMRENPNVTNFILGKIKEIREFYLENDEPEEIQAEDVLEDVKELATIKKEESSEELEDDEDELLLEDADVVQEKALTMLQEINAMNTAERIKLALGGSKTQRLILVKDTNKMVSLAVLESPKIGIDEVGLMVRNRSLPKELIARIARNREWTKNYTIIMELVHNPKTPVKDAMGLVKKLYRKDVQKISRDKNVNPVIRNVAVQLERQKSGVKR